MLDEEGLVTGAAKTLHKLMDFDQSGGVDFEEFTASWGRLSGVVSAQRQSVYQTQYVALVIQQT